MRKYLVIDTKTKKSVTVDLEEAARITGVDGLDITWALENEGSTRQSATRSPKSWWRAVNVDDISGWSEVPRS
jgi:hypothetical protein